VQRWQQMGGTSKALISSVGSIGVDENVTVAARRASYLPQDGFNVFVHRH
jgi:hypothetical protein